MFWVLVYWYSVVKLQNNCENIHNLKPFFIVIVQFFIQFVV